jgi:hypothetical protein
MSGIPDIVVDPENGVHVWQDLVDNTFELWYIAPWKALTQATLEFAEEYKWREMTNQWPSYDTVSSRWFDAVNTYLASIRYWQSPKSKEVEGYS